MNTDIRPISLLLTGAVFLSGPVAATAATAVISVLDDTTLVQDAGADDNNFGGRNELITSQTTTGNNRRLALLRFDVSSLAGQFSSIDSVSLQVRLNTGRAVPTTGQILDIFRMGEGNTGWVEGTGTGTTAGDGVTVPDTVTWRAKSDNAVVASRVNWAGSAGLATAGTDYFSASMGATNAFTTGAYAAGDVITITLTASGFTLNDMINDWLADGTANAGLLIRGRFTNTNNQIFFDSNETILAGAQAARLTINYTPVPEPGSLALLLLGTATAVTRRRR